LRSTRASADSQRAYGNHSMMQPHDASPFWPVFAAFGRA
jgi:hypothetical protein